MFHTTSKALITDACIDLFEKKQMELPQLKSQSIYSYSDDEEINSSAVSFVYLTTTLSHKQKGDHYDPLFV